MNNINIDNIKAQQPTINIGMIGSVSNGKSALVLSLTGKKTQQHVSEQKRGITIKLGYANAKIYKCGTCKPPICYDSYSSDVFSADCKHCGDNMTLERHVSFVDCPGHNLLMSTMLNGTCVMDSTIIVEAATNTIPAPQTHEHVLAANILKLDNKIVCMNKLDLVTKNVAKKKILELNTYLKDTIAQDSQIIPIIANLGINKDVICEYICTKIDEPKINLSAKTKMIIIRSFNINKPNAQVSDIKGGVIGGTVIEGTLKVGDKVTILPGILNKSNNDVTWSYQPLRTQIKSINSENNNLDMAIPGGLIGVQLSIDSALTAKDRLVGNIIKSQEDDDSYKVYEVILVYIEKFRQEKLKKNDMLKINHNACDINCIIENMDKDKIALKLIDKPICTHIGDYITISRKNGNNIILIGRAKIADGIESELII